MVQGIANVEALNRNVAHVREQRPQNGSGSGAELSGEIGGSRHHRCESSSCESPGEHHPAAAGRY